MPQQPERDREPDFATLVMPVPPRGSGPRARAVDDAWEAVVREELVRLRRRRARDLRHARDRRLARPRPQETT